MGLKYIKNTDDATIVCKISSDKNRAFVFRNKKVDKRNNIVLSNGYTEISEEDIKLLQEESSTFKTYFKMGKLSITDELPLDAMSSEQVVAALRHENALLKKQIKALRDGGTDGDSQELLSKIEVQDQTIASLNNELSKMGDLQTSLQEAHAKIEEQEKMIAGLDEQLAQMSIEMQELLTDTEEKEENENDQSV